MVMGSSRNGPPALGFRVTPAQERVTYLIAPEPLLKTWIQYAAMLALITIVVTALVFLLGPTPGTLSN